MKFFLTFILLSLFGVFIFPEIYAALAFGLTVSIALQIFLKSNESFMFREWALFLYASNYLLSPAITYQLNPDKVLYAMKIPSDTYFSLAFPGFLCIVLGMYSLSNNLFKPNFKELNNATILNERFLIQTTFFGILLRVFSDVLPEEIGFFIYLIAMVRFVSAFSLFGSNGKKYWWLALVVLFIELFYGFRAGMYHDAIMWVIFFALFFVYTVKPIVRVKSLGVLSLIILVLFIQAIKFAYREQIGDGGKEANLETISAVGSTKANSETLTSDENYDKDESNEPAEHEHDDNYTC
jgi:hypothetical protein